ncbi:MAG TPA: hypothetical protein VGO21_04375 [Candidatus Paceibacterota bacterium]|nr:hypothetical protein [Candidatus Paceibacterota bacterium]
MNKKQNKFVKVAVSLFVFSLLFTGAKPNVTLAETCSANTTQSFVSDSNTKIVGDGNAVPTYNLNPDWTASIPGATWIWSTYKVVNPLVNTTVRFQKDFNITDSNISSATLYFAADNGFKVTLNGAFLFQSDQNGVDSAFIKELQKTVNITSQAHTGSNTIIFEITNFGSPGTTPESNPAGLLYKIDVNSKNCTNPPQVCQDPTATNFGGALPCTYPAPTCQDPNATNYHGALPCTYPAPTCQDPSALNYHGTLPCRYTQPPQTCQDPSASNYGGTPPCTYPPQVCQDPSANNYHGALPCTYPPQRCQDPSADNYHGNLPCTYAPQVCQDTSALNYHGTLPCRYSQNNNNPGNINNNNNTNNNNPIINISLPNGGNNNTQTCGDPSALNYNGVIPCRYNTYIQTCQDPSASNYGGTLPCRYSGFTNNQPTVTISADQSSVAFNGATFVRWYTTNATSCFASGGSVGWAGAKSIGPGSFYTGSLTGARTYSISCSNSFGSASDSTTVTVRSNTTTVVTNNPPASSLVLITSSVDRNQPIVPTIDNTRPHPGDEINYTVSYQNIGTGSITNLTLQVPLPPEVDYLFSNPSNPTFFGNTLTFNLGTLRANGQGTVTVRVRVRQDIPPGVNLNFPAILSYTNPGGQTQSVNANVSAQVFSEPTTTPPTTNLGANVFGAGYLPNNVFGWLFLVILVLLLVYLGKYLFGTPRQPRYLLPTPQPYMPYQPVYPPQYQQPPQQNTILN